MLTIVPLALLTLAPELTTVTTLTADEAELTLADIFLSSEVAATFGIFREDDNAEDAVGVQQEGVDVQQEASPSNTDGSDDDERVHSRGGTAVSIMPPPSPCWASISGTMSEQSKVGDEILLMHNIQQTGRKCVATNAEYTNVRNWAREQQRVGMCPHCVES